MPTEVYSLGIININNPTNITENGCCYIVYESYIDDLEVNGSYAYIAHSGYLVTIVDVDNPNSPIAINDYFVSNGVHDLELLGDYAYLLSGSEIKIMNVSNPLNLQLMGSCNTYYGGSRLSLANGYAIVAEYYGVSSICVLNQSAPYLVGYYSKYGGIVDVKVQNNIAYVINYNQGLIVLDVSNPEEPLELATIDIDGLMFNTALSGDYLYVANLDYGLNIFDVSVPENPQEVGLLDLPGVRTVDVSGNYAYISAGDTLYVIDITNPANPITEGFIDIQSANIISIRVVDNYAYVNGGGLRIINISNPAIPVLTGSVNIGNSNGLSINGMYAYLGNGQYIGPWEYVERLNIINISNPSAPVLEHYYDTLDYIKDIDVVGEYAYVVGGTGLEVLKVSDPTNIVQTGFYNFPDAYGITMVGTTAYIARTYTFNIYDCSQAVPVNDESESPIATNIVFSNYPNPFSQNTAISFAMNKEDYAELTIFNQKGQIVKNLGLKKYDKGQNTVHWDGTDAHHNKVSSGIYIYRLKSGNHVLSNKMLFLK